MPHTVVRPGQTIDLARNFSLTGLAEIDGGAGGRAGGTVIVAGQSTIAVTGTLSIDGGGSAGTSMTPSPGGTLQTSGSLLNLGLLSAGAGSVQGGQIGQGGQIIDTGVLQNAGTIALASGKGTIFNPGAGGTLTVTGVSLNSGLITAGSTGAFAGTAALINRGQLTNTGTIALNAPSMGAVLSNSGSIDNAGMLIVGGAQSFQAATLDNAGVMTNSGDILVQGGAKSAYYEGKYPLSGGYFQAGGTLTNSGTIELAGGAAAASGQIAGAGGILGNDQLGTLINTGLILADGGAAPGAGQQGGDGASVFISGSTDNSGTIALGAGASSAFGAAAFVDGSLADSGLVSIAGGGGGLQNGFLQINAGAGVLLDGGTIAATGSFGGQEAVFNAGFIQGDGTISAPLMQGGGMINALFGTLVVNGSIGGAGTLEAYFGALVVNGRIAPAERVVLQAGTFTTGTQNAGLAISSSQSSVLVLSGGGNATLNAADTALTVDLTQSTNLTLSRMGFVTAIGSSGNDTITALAAAQTLAGGGGMDKLIGAAVSGDTFLGTASDLNGDTIGNFAGSDLIDATDLAPAGLSLNYAQGAGSGQLVLSEAGHANATITLLGTFSLSEFTIGSDSHGGAVIGLTAAGH